MRFACEQCQTKYTIPDERVRGKILKIRCKNCNCQITISEGGVRTARPVESAGDTIIPTKNSLPALGEGGDATMIGGMGDFFSAPGAAPGGPPDEWYISVDGQTAGPIPMQELAQRVVAEDGSPEREIFVWREGFGEWLPPGHVDDVKLAVAKERRNPAQKPRIATKLGLAPVSPVVPRPEAAPASAAVGASLVEENEDATQIGSLSAPIAPPPATKNEISSLALEAVDFDVVTDLPAPPKPKSPPAAEPPKPKGPPAFKPPPPVPAGAPARPAQAPRPTPPKSMPPFDITPSLAAPMSQSPMAPPSQPPPPAAAGSTSQSFAPPQAVEDPTGAMRGGGANMSPGMPGGAAGGQMPMGMMGAPDGMGAAPMEPGGAAGSPYGTGGVPPTASPKKTSPVILAALAMVVLLGASATVWVLTRPSKNAASKTQVVDAGPPADAMPAEPEKPAQEAAPAKPKNAKDDLLGLTADQRDALLDKNKKPLASCSSKLLKKEPKLAGASLSVEVTISAKGKIDTVEVASKDKELDGKAVKCYQKAIKRWKFPKRTDKTAYQIKFGLPI